jgi:pimeloyl-ACP methyl ester carboxylesterase
VSVPAFFVHGVPDTAALWNGVRENIDRDDVIAPNLPGFGAPVPDGFGATKEEYVDWVIGEIEKVGEPVDIVGHDWGSLIVQRVVSLRPDAIRTWAAGGATVDREYVWHDIAQMWQTPGVGEQVMEAMTGDALVDTLAEQLGGRDNALVVASHIDDTMKDCILKLYRSAADGFDAWHDDVDRVLPTRPGIVFWGADDPYVTQTFGERLAERTRATLVMFPDSGHWWPATRPTEVAARLDELWSLGS